ncbi:hypothetical protein Y032_0015g2544 [Ancylostoma ceylanicum]|uniref:Uncharacterized protein n=1 Tax=Ancylostoma ceylanicum TaxID=53326 RepID=A0A016V716_9BILA|nr:hypothetical protein Y032_0015g2544 [Ancylostoma ceylanicum]
MNHPCSVLTFTAWDLHGNPLRNGRTCRRSSTYHVDVLVAVEELGCCDSPWNDLGIRRRASGEPEGREPKAPLRNERAVSEPGMVENETLNQKRICAAD